MTIGKEVYDQIISHCGDIKNVRGVTENALKNLKDGKNNPSVPLLSKIAKANSMVIELVFHVKQEGKAGKTTIKL